MQRRSVLLIGISLALMVAGTNAVGSSQTVWSALVVANNVAQPEEAPVELKKLESTLKELFGYNQYTVIGQTRKAVVTGSEDWMAQSKYFSLHVDSKQGNDKTGYVLDLKLFREKNLLLETETKLTKQSPLVIRGPQVGDGQLILLLVVQ
jgi:predicted ATPase